MQKNKFKFVPAKSIRIPKGKDKKQFRPLVVARVESRIVQRAIHDVLSDVPALQPLIYTPHSFGGVKKRLKKELAAVPAAIQAVSMLLRRAEPMSSVQTFQGFSREFLKVQLLN